MLWLKNFFRKLYQMWPRAKRYGLRYYWDYEFRKRVRNREVNKRSRQKYGTVFLSNKKRIKHYLISKYGRRCKYCRKKFRKKNLTIDHIIPVHKVAPTITQTYSFFAKSATFTRMERKNKILIRLLK